MKTLLANIKHAIRNGDTVQEGVTMEEDKPDWRDPNSGCYCVVCLAPVREDIFVQRGGCCPNHKFDDECTYK